ncbi:hypothetical protein ACR56S_03935 [Staphylococcus hominis]|uniref:hypothetical protein n=1 Tax=Staphylococcus hominis TaxID=1290 RepID=UPI003DA03AC9
MILSFIGTFILFSILLTSVIVTLKGTKPESNNPYNKNGLKFGNFLAKFKPINDLRGKLTSYPIAIVYGQFFALYFTLITFTLSFFSSSIFIGIISAFVTYFAIKYLSRVNDKIAQKMA